MNGKRFVGSGADRVGYLVEVQERTSVNASTVIQEFHIQPTIPVHHHEPVVEPGTHDV